MILGVVNDNRALVTLTVLGLHELDVEFLLDTGFSGQITLPPSVAERLRLPWVSTIRARLAGRIPITAEVFEATVLWDGEERTLEVLAIDDDALLGMAALEGNEVRLVVENGGEVEIGG